MRISGVDRRSGKRDVILRALLVEDNPVDARLIEILLKDANDVHIDVHIACDLQSGLAHMESEQFDIVLLDIMLPDAVGASNVRQIRMSHPSVPIVVLSGLDDEHAIAGAIDEGAHDYLLKDDMSPRSLLHSVRFAIRRQRSAAERDDVRTAAITDDRLDRIEQKLEQVQQLLGGGAGMAKGVAAESSKDPQ